MMADEPQVPTRKQMSFDLWVWRQPWMCGCWMPEETIATVTRVLEWAGGGSPREPIWESLGNGPFQFIANVLSSGKPGMELMEHGGSVGGSWLTERGKRALPLLKEWSDATMHDENGDRFSWAADSEDVTDDQW